MVGASEGQLLVRNGDTEWQEVTTFAPAALDAGYGYPWMGNDGVGFASSAGTTICPYDW